MSNSKRRRLAPDRMFVDLPFTMNEKLSVEIHAKRVNEADMSSYVVEINARTEGIFTATISPEDVANFSEFGSIKLRLKTMYGDHVFALLRNSRFRTCELHDSNGSLFATNEKLAPELLKALHRGLLRPLISPESGPPQDPFSGNFSREAPALQIIEINLCFAVCRQLEELNNEKLKQLLFPILKNPEDKIHNSFGLCSAWVTFKQIDKYRNDLRFFNFIEKAASDLNTSSGCLETNQLKEAAYGAWYNQFELDLKQKLKYNIAPLVIRPIFVLMLLPILIRMLSMYFVALSKGNIERQFGNEQHIKNMLWPDFDSADDLESSLSVLYSAYQVNGNDGDMGLIPNNSDFYQIRFLAYNSPFPYPSRVRLSGAPPSHKWIVSVDTQSPVSSQQTVIIDDE